MKPKQIDHPEVVASDASLGEKRLSRLLEVGRALVSELELDVVLELVIEAARDLTGARYAAIGVLDESRETLERFITAGIDESTHEAIGKLPRGRGVLGVLISEPKPLRLNDVGHHPQSFGFPPGHPPMSSFLGVPILVRGRVYGNLYLTEKRGAAFDETDERVVIVLAEWAAVAIDNARAYATAESRRAELERAVASLEATTTIAQTLAGETDLQTVVELVAKRGRALVDSRSMAVLVPRGAELAVAAIAGDLDQSVLGERVPLDGSVSGTVFRAGNPERVADFSSRLSAAFEKRAGVSSALFVPLRFRGRILGVLAALDRLGGDGGAGFTPTDERALVGFAASAAAAIATAQDVAEQTGRRSVAAAESERARWARELHDDTLQELAALKLLLASVRRSDDPAERQTVLAEASDRIDYAVRSLRALITDLRPAALDDLGLGSALEALVDRVAQANAFRIDLTLDMAFERGREATRLTREVEEGTYRLVQECLSNVIKHAGASEVAILVRESAEAIEVEATDNGAGFDSTGPSAGFGLVGMRERVALLGGWLAIETSPGGGTTIRLSLPVAREEPLAANAM